MANPVVMNRIKTLVIGNNNSPQASFISGFTLLEVLLVVLIVAIMAAAGVGLINSQSPARLLQSRAGQWQQGLTYLCEQALLDNRTLGIEFTEHDNQVLAFADKQWQPLIYLRDLFTPENIELRINSDGREMTIPQKFEDLPHIVCYSDGRISNFSMILQLQNITDFSYELTSKNPWQISGGWHAQP